MEIQIMALQINNEMDIMLAHRRGMQFARYLGISLSEQTRFATAVSEICRNSLEYATDGVINFSVLMSKEKCFLSAVIRDKGTGITLLDEILRRRPEDHKGRGLGLVYAKRLADNFRITSNTKGTTVYLQKTIPSKTPVINKLIVQGWVRHLQNEPAISAYEELKMRNLQLVELSEELKANADTVDSQMKEIQKLNDKLSKTNDRLKEFTYAISHDLKTPLSSLRIAAEYIRDNKDGEDMTTYKAILSRSVHRLDKTIHSLIEILDQQNQEKHIIRELDFNTLFEEARDEHDQKIEESGTRITTDFSEAAKIHYIEGYLQSIFRNLLSNSLKYRDLDRPLQITVTTAATSDGIRLVFADTGSGMDLNKVKDRLFVPFTRFSNSSDGKGIGLYLIKGMVESNGGTVIVESEVGAGTTFIVTLLPYK